MYVGGLCRTCAFTPDDSRDAVPDPVADEPTVPERPIKMAELVRRPRIVPARDWDALNGVDDRGGW